MSLSSNPKFIEALKTVENNTKAAARRGTYKDVQGEMRWFPDKSPEGGLPTLAYGHKITIEEWNTKRIHLLDPNTTQDSTRDFRYGITDGQATQLLKQDVETREKIAERDWNHYQGQNVATGEPKAGAQWNDLKEGYRMVLLDKAFNAGLVKNGKWIWVSLAQHILNKDDTGVVLNSVAKWKDTEGTVHKLTSRAIEICKAAGLPWQALEE